MLEVVQGNDAGREFELADEAIVLGRDEDCCVLIDDEQASRRHAQLTLAGDGCAIEDLRSTNGTFVNGERITARRTLWDGDRIGIGSTRFVLRHRTADEHTTRASDAARIRDSVRVHADTTATALVNAEVKLQAILKITEALGATLDLEAVLSKMLDGLLDIFRHADRALVLLLEGDQLVLKAAKHRRGTLHDLQYSTTIVRRAIDSREAIVSTDVVVDDRLPVTRSLAEYGIRSIMCVPLFCQPTGVLGVIQLDAQTVGAEFDAGDAAILASVARQASISVEYAQLHSERLKQARLQKEMALVHRRHQRSHGRRGNAVQ
jgi:hypothetical protein